MRSVRLSKKRFLVGTLILFLIIGVSLFRLDRLNSTLINPANFSWINKAEIYVLGLLIGVAGYPLYPEVAREHLMMYRPFPNHPKTIESDFFRGSPVIENAIRKTQRLGKPYRLAWPASAYKLSFEGKAFKEARIALALNGGYLRLNRDKVIVKVSIKYPPKSFAPLVPLGRFGTIGVEEGLFWLLQKEGWLYSGDVEWIAPYSQ